MSIRSEDWLDVAACHTVRPECVPAPRVRLADLTSVQKREMAGVTVSGLMSCAFVLAAIVVTNNPSDLRATALAIQFVPAPRLASAIYPVAATDGLTGHPLPRRTRRSTHASGRPRIGTPIRTAVIRTEMEGDAETSGPDQRASAVRLQSGISRMLLGDGRYRVKPFPTLADED